MKIENKTTSAASSVQTKPASQKPSSEAKKNGPPVTAEKPSAMSEKISSEDKYEKERKSDKKEEVFDNVSDLRSMSEKTSLKKEEKPEKLAKEKERKKLITSILYEWMINEDGRRIPGRQIGLITFRGDGTPGKIEYFDTCNEIWDIRDVTHCLYKEKLIILDKQAKRYLAMTLNRPIHITTGCKWVGDVHCSWKIQAPCNMPFGLITFKIPDALCGNITAKIVEED